MKVASKVVLILATVFSSTAFAAGGGDGIPVTMVILQAINVSLFVGLLAYLLKGPVKTYFKNREDEFTAAARKAEELKAEAARHRKEIADKLKELEDNAEKTIQNAKSEAEALKENILKEAKEMAAKIQAEAERSTQNEVARAKEELRRSLLNGAIDAAREAAAKGLTEQDQKRLQGEFVNKVGSMEAMS